VSEHELARPQLVHDETTEEYWAAASRGELALPRYSKWRRLCFPPIPVCPKCTTTDPRYEYERVEGAGVLKSWSVARDAFLPGFGSDVPYGLVDVQLDCEPSIRMIGRLLDGPEVGLHIEDRVRLAFESPANCVAAPGFTLVSS
jgi:uncharacterized OB-fold protein